MKKTATRKAVLLLSDFVELIPRARNIDEVGGGASGHRAAYC